MQREVFYDGKHRYVAERSQDGHWRIFFVSGTSSFKREDSHLGPEEYAVWRERMVNDGYERMPDDQRPERTVEKTYSRFDGAAYLMRYVQTKQLDTITFDRLDCDWPGRVFYSVEDAAGFAATLRSLGFDDEAPGRPTLPADVMLMARVKRFASSMELKRKRFGERWVPDLMAPRPFFRAFGFLPSDVPGLLESPSRKGTRNGKRTAKRAAGASV